MALQPRVHVPHNVHRKASFAEKRNDVWCTSFHDGVLLGNIEISDDGAFAISGDPWKRKNGSSPSEKRQQIV
jgi:hypothetical protein